MLKEKIFTFLNINILQKKQLLKFFLIFLILIIIPVIISSTVIYYYSNSIIENEIKKSNNIAMSNMIDYIDEELFKIKLGIIKFSLDIDLRRTLNTKGSETIQMHEYSNIMQKLRKLENSNLEYGEVFIYYLDTDFILSRDGSYDFEFYFNKVNDFGDYDAKAWEKLFMQGGDFEIIIADKVSGLLWENTDINNVIAIKTSLPFYSAPNAALVIFLNEDFLRNTVAKYGRQSNSSYTILNKDGDIISSERESIILDKQKFKEDMKKYTTDKEGSFKITDEGRIFLVTYNTSSFVDWIYLALVPFKEISEQSRYIQTVTFYVIVVFTIIGIFAAFWLGKKQYKPIASLVEYLNKLSMEKDDMISKKGYNEYNFITGQVNKILAANESLNKSFSASIPFLKENLLYRILNGNISSKHEIREELKKYNIIFTKSMFRVIGIRFDILYDSPACIKESKDKMQLEFTQIRDNLFHIIFAMLTKKLDCYQVELDIFKTAYIVNYNEDSDNIIIDTCNAVAGFFNQDEYQVKLSIGVGLPCHEIEDIRDSFSQAIKSVEFRTISTKSEVIIFSHEFIGRNKRLFEIFDVDIKSISNSLLSGNYKESISLAQMLLDKCVEEGITYNELYKIMSILVDSVFHIINVKRCEICDSDINEKEIYEQIEGFNTIQEHKQFITELLNTTARQLKEQGNARKDEIVDFIVNYVNQKYNCDIYLETIADELRMSSNYLSHFFKESMGLSFSDFLGKIRVEKAKEMIRTTDKPINTICFEVGYVNVNSFIRSFKKFEGITPGRYREIVT